MKTKKSRVVLSSISVVLVLSLFAGMTMAWFTDTEKVNGNFMAGVLDISVKPGETGTDTLEFKNLRPMLKENFEKELKDNGTGEWFNDVTQKGDVDLKDSDYAPVPAYFKPVTITNEGTLPAYISLTVEPKLVKCLGEENTGINSDNKNTVTWDKDHPVTCTNGLQDKLKIFVYRNVAMTGNPIWEKVDNINLNTGSKTDDEKNQYNPGTVLAAKETVQYVIAGYLPGDDKDGKTVDNTYQGKHFHGDVVVNAFQPDDDSRPNPDTVGHSINITFKDDKDDTDLGQTEYRFETDKGTTTYDLRETKLQEIMEGVDLRGYDITKIGYLEYQENTNANLEPGLHLVIEIENDKVLEKYKNIVVYALQTSSTSSQN